MHWTKKSERRTARKYGWRRQPGSGCLSATTAKDDHRLRGLIRVEQKDAIVDAHTLSATKLATLVDHARTSSELPVMLIIHRLGELMVLTADDLDGLTVDAQITQVLTRSMTMARSHRLWLPTLLSALGDAGPQMGVMLVHTPVRDYKLGLGLWLPVLINNLRKQKE